MAFSKIVLGLLLIAFASTTQGKAIVKKSETLKIEEGDIVLLIFNSVTVSYLISPRHVIDQTNRDYQEN